ncbi:hypothetical protein BDQ17DRAFT_187969 [Cyathus striatus]|nr:hypothetical protein BDQ17DRAFT_187969 [Cyathus striatus]
MRKRSDGSIRRGEWKGNLEKMVVVGLNRSKDRKEGAGEMQDPGKSQVNLRKRGRRLRRVGSNQQFSHFRLRTVFPPRHTTTGSHNPPYKYSIQLYVALRRHCVFYGAPHSTSLCRLICQPLPCCPPGPPRFCPSHHRAFQTGQGLATLLWEVEPRQRAPLERSAGRVSALDGDWNKKRRQQGGYFIVRLLTETSMATMP